MISKYPWTLNCTSWDSLFLLALQWIFWKPLKMGQFALEQTLFHWLFRRFVGKHSRWDSQSCDSFFRWLFSPYVSNHIKISCILFCGKLSFYFSKHVHRLVQQVELRKKDKLTNFFIVTRWVFHVLDMHSSKSINANFHSLYIFLWDLKVRVFCIDTSISIVL